MITRLKKYLFTERKGRFEEGTSQDMFPRPIDSIAYTSMMLGIPAVLFVLCQFAEHIAGK